MTQEATRADARRGGPGTPPAYHYCANADVAAAGTRLARALDTAGVPADATVAVLGGNTPEFLATLRGVTWSGRTLTPMSTRWTPEEVAYVVGNCEARAVVLDARYPQLAEACRDVPVRFAHHGALPGARPWTTDVDGLPAEALTPPTAGTIMYYTSGTTGRPRGVRFDNATGGPPPHLRGQAGMRMLRLYLAPEEEQGRHLVCTPLYHAGPLSYADGSLLLGADVVMLERFDPESVLALIDRYRVVSAFLVPTQFVRLLRLPAEVRARYDVSSLKVLLHGSAPVAPDVKRAMIDWFGPVLYEFYGGSEGGGTSISSTEWLAHPGSVGRPMPGYRIDILDDDGNPVPAGEPGQVWFQGAAAFRYKDEPDKTAEARRGDRHTLGDIGALDADGYLYLHDRRADVIISGGVNIYPAQVEAALQAHPAVDDCCVVGVPDDEWGEAVHAVVQPAAGLAADEALSADLLAHLRGRLASYQVPRTVEFREHLPRTETGKLARRTIRSPYWAGRDRRI